MKKNTWALTFTKHTASPANDELFAVAANAVSPSEAAEEDKIRRGWDPYEVWRTRVRMTLRREPKSG